MAENSKIQWTDHTFNHIRGCTKVSPACENCYAETMSKRNQKTLGVWGKYGTRVVASESMWKQPVKWNREAEASGVRKKVFCASLADVFESLDTVPQSSHLAVQQARSRLFSLIRETPNLDWLLLTKRAEEILKRSPFEWINHGFPANVWIGTTVENQRYADIRIPELLKVNATVRFLSVEPMLGPIDLSTVPFLDGDKRHKQNPLTGQALLFCKGVNGHADFIAETEFEDPDRINWVIVGCESGSNRRPMKLEWAESIVDQCKAAGVPVFVKQLEINGKVTGDIEQFPRELQIREFPAGR